MAGTEPLNKEVVSHAEKPQGLKVEDNIVWKKIYWLVVKGVGGLNDHSVSGYSCGFACLNYNFVYVVVDPNQYFILVWSGSCCSNIDSKSLYNTFI